MTEIVRILPHPVRLPRFSGFLSGLILLLAALPLAAQQPVQPQAPALSAPQSSSQGSDSASPDRKITPQEAQELLRSVDSILQFDSQDTALPKRRDIKRQLVDRKQVEQYVHQRMDQDEDARRLRRSGIVLKKFGLLPRDFDLQTFLVTLLREQVAGYYDAKTRTVNLLDWLPPEQQQPVLAHELTHALQDQNFGLEKWVREGNGSGKHGLREEVESDEAVAARDAVVEGQAMAVMIDFILAPTGASLLDSPNIADAITHGLMQGNDSPVFNSAPLYLKEVLLFPYSYGLDFVRALLGNGGKERAFAGVFKDPPVSTRQIMQPDTYLQGEKLPALPMPDFDRLAGKGYERYDVGSVGEFDTSVLTKQFSDYDTARRLWPEWRGGYYYAARKKGAPESDLELVYVSRWASSDAASRFARLYASSVRRRYDVSRGWVSPASDAGLKWRFDTSEGQVLLSADGDTVVSIEGFDAETAARLESAVGASSKAEAQPAVPAGAR